MRYVYAIDVDNMHSYSDNDHFILQEVYARKSDAVEMLEGKGFKPVHDNWKGETVYRWSFPKMDEACSDNRFEIKFPDPYQNAYERVIIELESRIRRREMDGLEAALKEYGYVKERTCKNVDEYGSNVGGERNWETNGFGFECSCCGAVLNGDEFGKSPLESGFWSGEYIPISYCPNCGARVVG